MNVKKISTVHLLLNQYENDSRVKRETNTLANQGHLVKILALHKDGLATKEMQGSIQIIRLKLVSRKFKFKGAGALKYMEYTLRALPHCLSSNVIHCHDFDPLPMSVLAKLISLFRIKLIYDSHELQTEVATISPGLRKDLFKKLEVMLIWACDGFITVSESIANTYFQRSGVKAVVIYNCPETQSQDFSPKRASNQTTEIPSSCSHLKVFLYQGLFVKNRGLEETLNAFTQLGTEACLCLVGVGELQPLIDKFAAQNSNIFCLGFVESDKLLEFTQNADFGIIATERNCLNHEYSLPNKFFEYATAAIPILSVGTHELSKLTTNYHCGHCFEYVTVESIVKGVRAILKKNYSEMKSGTEKLVSAYNWKNQEVKLVELYNNISKA